MGKKFRAKYKGDDLETHYNDSSRKNKNTLLPLGTLDMIPRFPLPCNKPLDSKSSLISASHSSSVTSTLPTCEYMKLRQNCMNVFNSLLFYHGFHENSFKTYGVSWIEWIVSWVMIA